MTTLSPLAQKVLAALQDAKIGTGMVGAETWIRADVGAARLALGLAGPVFSGLVGGLADAGVYKSLGGGVALVPRRPRRRK